MDTINLILKAQRSEITEHYIYKRLALTEKSIENRDILETIANDELKHYEILKRITKKEVTPCHLKIHWYTFLARVLGITFALKLMERGEDTANNKYQQLANEYPQLMTISSDEQNHENQLLNMLQEKKLEYAGSIVLGLNDALVELTGALAGFTFAMQETKTVALAGLITGVAASLSMASSEYLSKTTEGKSARAFSSSLYTGTAYLITVALLIMPYLLMTTPIMALATTLLFALLIIAGFNFYISVAKDLNFRKRFLEMALISLGVAAISFGIGYLIKEFLGVSM